MNLQDVVKRDYIVTDMAAENRDDALRELIAVAESTGNISDSEGLFSDLLEREAAFTTKIMAKIAIPHAKSDGVAAPMVFIGKSGKGISWTVDGSVVPEEDRVYLIFLILVPAETEGNAHLKLLATLSRCLSHESFRNEIHATDDKEQIIAAIERKMQEINNR